MAVTTVSLTIRQVFAILIMENVHLADPQTNKGSTYNDMNLKVLDFKSGQFQKSELRV